MLATTLDDVLTRLRASLERDDLSGAVAIIEAMRPPDQAELFSELQEEDQAALLPRLDPTYSAGILEELDNTEAAELVATLSADDLVLIIDEMAPDEAADLLNEIEPEQAQAILARLEDPDEIRPLLLHPYDSAGGLMTSEFLALRRRMTAAEAMAAIRAWKPDSEDIYYLFVVDRYGKLCGVVNLRQLVTIDLHTLLSDIMDAEVVSVTVGTDQEECARIMSRYDLLALPVVEADGTLVGMITIDDVVDVLEDEATEDIQRLGATEPLDRPYLDTSILTIVRKRVGWLLMLFLTGTLTGSVMHYFEDELQTAVTLSVFIPLLIGTGGNAGSQTTSTIIRAVAVDELDKKPLVLPFWHELRAGVVLGLSMALAATVVVLASNMGLPLAMTVATAIFCIVVWSNTLGSLLPLIAVKIGIDPTVVSGPAMSTVVDATGLFIYFSIAKWMLGL